MDTDQSRIDIGHQPQTAADFGVSYFLSIDIPPGVADALEDAMMTVAREVGNGFYVQPAASLHISVLDFVDGIIDPNKFGYKDKATVWAKIGRLCEQAVQKTVANLKPFDITFNEFVVTDTAVIIKGEDDGYVKRLRDSIMAAIGDIRLPRTKNPPAIIHTSLARFTKVMPLEPVRRAVAEESPDFVLHIDHLTLRNQLKVNMLESQVLQVYDLG